MNSYKTLMLGIFVFIVAPSVSYGMKKAKVGEDAGYLKVLKMAFKEKGKAEKVLSAIKKDSVEEVLEL